MTQDDNSGFGQGMTAAKIKPAIMRRIDRIARRVQATEKGDIEALYRIMDEYYADDQPERAAAVRLTIERILLG